MSKVFKLVKTNSALDFLKNNTSSATASEDIIFDKIQGRVSFNYYIKFQFLTVLANLSDVSIDENLTYMLFLRGSKFQNVLAVKMFEMS